MALWQIPAVVLAFLAWMSAPPTSLADASRREALRRQLAPKTVHSYTNDSLPAPPPAPPASAAPPPDVVVAEPPPGEVVAAVPPVAAALPPADVKHDEAWWRDRLATALDTVERDSGLVDAMQSRINALTTDWTNRDNPVQKAQLFEQRQRAITELDRLKKQVIADRAAVDAVREDGRRQGIPAGWIR